MRSLPWVPFKNEERVHVKSSALAEKIVGHTTWQKNTYKFLSVLSPLQPTGPSDLISSQNRIELTVKTQLPMEYGNASSHSGKTENKSDLQNKLSAGSLK